MFVPPDSEYCSNQIQNFRFGSQSTSWSQQNSPRSDGKEVNGSTKVHVRPASGDRLAYQLPVMNTPDHDEAALGSPTVPVWVPVDASARLMLSRIVTTGGRRSHAGSVGATGARVSARSRHRRARPVPRSGPMPCGWSTAGARGHRGDRRRRHPRHRSRRRPRRRSHRCAASPREVRRREPIRHRDRRRRTPPRAAA